MERMTDASGWSRAAVPGRRVGHAVEFHAALSSTNDRARAALGEPDGEGRAIVADEQTAGRGRRGRQWLSPAGRNLMLSVGLRPRLEPGVAGLLGIAAALAVRDACAAAGGADLGLRWPNDVVAADGRKVAGLLIETTLSDGSLLDAVIGAGINANWARSEMPPEIAERATSLADLVGGEIDRVTLLAAVLARLDGEIVGLERGLTPIDRYRRASSLDGRAVTVQVDEATLDGVVGGIADDGALLLDTEAGRLALTVGEVVAVRDAPVGAPA